MSATTTWTNGTLKTGAANTGQKRRNFCSMPPNTRNVCPLPGGVEKGIICSGSAFSGQYRIILSADAASEVRQMPSQKRR